MELDLVLNWINPKFIVKMIEIKSFRNPKNRFQKRIESLLKTKKQKLGLRLKVFFEIKNQTTFIYA